MSRKRIEMIRSKISKMLGEYYRIKIVNRN